MFNVANSAQGKIVALVALFPAFGSIRTTIFGAATVDTSHSPSLAIPRTSTVAYGGTRGMELKSTETAVGSARNGHWAGNQHSTASEKEKDSSQYRDSFLTFTSTNNYEPVSWSPWKHLAEPYRESTLTASSDVGDTDRDVFIWSLLDEDNTVLEGRVVKHTFKRTGRTRVSLTQIVVSTGQSYHLHGYIMVKYVRREIRQLSEVDREAFFKSMEVLYRLPTKEGLKLYGSEYKGIDFFVQMHLDGAGIKDCDHWHDDAGIMTHHVAYTLQFEQALQLVDPSVAIPYWEYTMEASDGYDSYGDSPVFADDWFGNASPTNPLHTVDTGRWAYLGIMQQAWEYVHNPYGLLRTPWNLDSSPYVTRHNMTNGNVAYDMVSCETYDMCFIAKSMSSMNNCLNGGTHGPVHILIGGEWGDPEDEFITKTGYAGATPLVTKFLWRKGYLRYPETCTRSHSVNATSEDSCRTSCPSELYKSRGMTEYDVLMDVSALHWLAGFTDGVVRYSQDEDKFYVYGHEDDEDYQNVFWSKMLHSLCDPGHLGEMYTSSAPYDPLFWVIHPSAERFLGWRRLLGSEGITGYEFDETWGYDHGNVVGESGMICDWSDVRPGTLDMPTCTYGICGGHKEQDMLPFKIKLNDKTVKMTNAEWINFIYPKNEHLPYMYNEFRWDHCIADGYDLGTREQL